MALIHTINTQPFRLEMKGSLSWGKASRLEALEHVLVRVVTDEGHVGVAEAPVRPTIYGETVASVEATVRELLAPKLEGLDVRDEAGISNVLHSIPHNHTARGALDMALHDARAQAAGTTLFEAQRGEQTHIRVSFILGISDLATMLSEAREIYTQGVSVFKIKIGRDSKADEAVIRALQTEFGSDVILYADANENLSPTTAAATLTQLARLGIAYVEEPLSVEYVKARAALRKAEILPIIADDSCFTLRDLRRELELDTFDILNIKTARTGFTESQGMLELAQSAGKGVMLGSQAGSGLGTLHCAIFASKAGVTHPSELSFPLKLKEDVLNAPLHYRNGVLEVASLAGLQLQGRYLQR